MHGIKELLLTISKGRDKTHYERKCADLDNAIDTEVYKLYGLTEEEIKIVGGKNNTTSLSYRRRPVSTEY